MNKYDRLLFILNLLRSRRNLNASLIAEECGVAERTIYRDIIALSEANIPIYYDHGYKYASDNFLPPLNFSIEEYLTLSAALESSPLSETGVSKGVLKGVKTKIEAALSQDVRKGKLGKNISTKISIKDTSKSDSKEKFYPLIEDAVKRNIVLRLEYDSIESGVSIRLVEPYFMIFIERAFYFVAYCRKRKGLRTFRLDRIKGIELTEEAFVPRENIDPAGYFKDSWGVFGGDPEEIEVIFTGKAARVVKTARHHNNEKIEKLGKDKVRYTIRVSGVDEIMRWIIGFGGEAKVVQPTSLVTKIKHHAEEILEQYKS